MPKDGETVALSTNFLVWAKQAKDHLFCKNFFEMQIFFHEVLTFLLNVIFIFHVLNLCCDEFTGQQVYCC